MSEVTLRARREDDVAAIAAMMRLPGVLRGTLRLPFATDAFYRDWTAEGPAHHAIIADVDGRAVGQCVVTRGTGRRAHAGSLALCVHDDFCSRGIGSALTAAALALADDWLGLRRIHLEVYADNLRAIALYERHGFEREGLLRAESLREGRLVDALVMGRLKAAPERLEVGP